MKAEPTDIDREAARLFAPAPGMRSWLHCDGVPSRILSDSPITRWAIDTDDPATVGCMLAQVEDAAGESVEMVRYSCLAEAVWTCGPPGATGRTRGAALVAAMRVLKGSGR